MIYDIDQQQLEDLTSAFRAGEHRGRQQADEHLLEECVELRVRLVRRESWQATLVNLACASVVVGSWAGVALSVWWVAS